MKCKETIKNTKIILASASPRRSELLRQIGLDFQVLVSNAEEKITTDIPHKVVEELSAQKAGACFDSLMQKFYNASQSGDLSDDALENKKTIEPAGVMVNLLSENGVEEARAENLYGRNLLVIGADTVVACNGRILGKPSDAEEAAEMLQLLQGNSHQVYTGVTLVYYNADSKKTESKTVHEVTNVTFYSMTEEEIASYVSTGDPLDKAGAYGIQGLCAKFIKGIEGDYNNVVGLPVARLYQEAKDWL